MSYVTYSRNLEGHMRGQPKRLLGIDTIKQELDKLYPQNNLLNLEYTVFQAVIEVKKYSPADIISKIERRQNSNKLTNLERVLEEARDIYKVRVKFNNAGYEWWFDNSYCDDDE